MKRKLLVLLSVLFILSLTLAFGACNGKEKRTEKREIFNFATEINIEDYFGDGDTLINAKLYDANGNQLEVKNGRVLFEQLGVYKLVLKSGTTYLFEVIDEDGPVAMLKEQSTLVYKGDEVKVDVFFVDRAGADVLEYSVQVTLEENEIDVTDGRFVATETGIYTVTVDATDVLGNRRVTEIAIESMETVYGKGIYVIPEQDNASVITYREKYTEGENAGKYRTVIRKDSSDSGFGYLTVKATKEAGLKPNTYYGLVLQVDSDNDKWCYYNPDNEWLTSKARPMVTFTVKTDERGEYYKRWWVFYRLSSYFDFSYVGFHEYAYGQGVFLTAEPKPYDPAIIDNLEQFEEKKDDGSGLYVKGLKRNASDRAVLSVNAKKEAGLLPNTQYDVVIEAECDGEYPAYYEVNNGWFIDTENTRIKATVTTDTNGEFSLSWFSHFRTGTYVKFTDVKIERTPESAYGKGITITPTHSVATIGKELLTEVDGVGQQIVVMTKPDGKDGAGKLTISASVEAGLQANTAYVVTMKIITDRTDGKSDNNAYYDNNTNGVSPQWLAKPSSSSCSFEVTTDENGEFTQTFKTWWAGKSTFVRFEAITIVKK